MCIRPRSLLASPSGRLSIHKLYNDLRSQGIAAGKDALHEFLAHLEDAFLLFNVALAAESPRVRQVNPRNCCAVDTGLARVFLRGRVAIGQLLENAVYLELRRRGYETSYVRTDSGYEVDFLAERHGERRLVQVSAELAEPATRERELRAIRGARVVSGCPAHHRDALRRRPPEGAGREHPDRARLAVPPGGVRRF